jgi:enoyl-CoA hydratase/carnithine racemase
MPETLLYSVADGIATVTLNRPDKLNAFNAVMFREFVEVFDETDRDDDVRAVVVTGAGRAFCAGADVSGGAKTFKTDALEGGAEPRDAGGVVALRIFRSLKPVIGAINGSAVGVGVTMTLPMDVRILADHAKVGFVFASRGITLDGAASWFLPRIVGIGQALEWSLTARLFKADEALAGGLVSRVLPADEVLPAALQVAKEIATNAAPLSAVITRQLLWRMLGAEHPMETHRIDTRAIRFLGRTPDSAEGVRAFLEKRASNWTGAPSTDLPPWFPWQPEPPYEE